MQRAGHSPPCCSSCLVTKIMIMIITILLQLLPGNQDHDHDHHDHHDHPDHHHHHPVAALAWSDHDHHHHEDCQRWQLEMKNQSKLKRLNRSSLVSVHSSGLLRWTTFQKIKEMFVQLKSKSLYSVQSTNGRGKGSTGP